MKSFEGLNVLIEILGSTLNYFQYNLKKCLFNTSHFFKVRKFNLKSKDNCHSIMMIVSQMKTVITYFCRVSFNVTEVFEYFPIIHFKQFLYQTRKQMWHQSQNGFLQGKDFRCLQKSTKLLYSFGTYNFFSSLGCDRVQDFSRLFP